MPVTIAGIVECGIPTTATAIDHPWLTPGRIHCPRVLVTLVRCERPVLVLRLIRTASPLPRAHRVALLRAHPAIAWHDVQDGDTFVLPTGAALAAADTQNPGQTSSPRASIAAVRPTTPHHRPC